MRRYLLVLLLLMTACSIPVPMSFTDTPAASPATWTASPTASVEATSTSTVTPTSALVITATPEPTPAPGPGLDPTGIRLFPSPLYAGDFLSADVKPRLPQDISGPLTVTLALPNGELLSSPVTPSGLDGRYRARFYWAWQIPPDAQTSSITFTLLLAPDMPDPDSTDNVLALPVALGTPDTFLPPEPEARWTLTEAPNFRLHYLTDTAAERDLQYLAGEAEAAYSDVMARLTSALESAGLAASAVPTAPVDIYLLDRVIGQGGYASTEWVAISYTDRNYAPVDLALVLRHELTHRLDDMIGCRNAPSLLREGLAVYIAGGHYRPESLPQKAAALLTTDHYIPLPDLAQDFYAHQHEISYAEAGALVAYLVEYRGWAQLRAVCLASAEVQGSDRERLDAGFQTLALTGLGAFEEEWLAWLRAIRPTPEEQAVFTAEVQLMDTMRAYQLVYDPRAHFLEGILFDPQEGARKGATADFVRHPRDAQHIALELMLAMAQEALRLEDWAAADVLVAEVNRVLASGVFASGRAADDLAIVNAALAQGDEPYRFVESYGEELVYGLTYAAWPARRVLVARWEDGRWKVTPLQPTE